MEAKGIIKNIDKFNDIKLATGIDLTLYATRNRRVNLSSSGVSTETYGSKWFMTHKGRGLFKTYDSYFDKKTKQIRMYNELLCQELCKQVGIRCATYERAHINGIDGLITYDFVGKNKMVTIFDFMRVDKNLELNLLDCARAIDIYAYNGYSINKKQAIVDLYKMIVFDTITLQTDRNPHNINMLYDGKKIQVAPLIDNEFAFGGERLIDSMEFEEECESLVTFDDLVSKHAKSSKIFTFDDCYTSDDRRYKNNIQQITFYAKKHPALMNVLQNMLQNLDIDKAMAELDRQGAQVNPYYKEYIRGIVTKTKSLLVAQKKQRVYKEELNDYENIY